MIEYNKNDLFAKKIKKTEIKIDSWKNETIDKANYIFYNSKQKPQRKKIFF